MESKIKHKSDLLQDYPGFELNEHQELELVSEQDKKNKFWFMFVVAVFVIGVAFNYFTLN